MSIKAAKPQAASCVGTRLLIAYAGVIYLDYVCFLFLWHLLFISKFTLICFYESLTNVDVIQSSDLR